MILKCWDIFVRMPIGFVYLLLLIYVSAKNSRHKTHRTLYTGRRQDHSFSPFTSVEVEATCCKGCSISKPSSKKKHGTSKAGYFQEHMGMPRR